MNSVIYDKIGKTYDATRRADPEILAKIIDHLSPKKSGHYLDVGCGSGNYTQALFQKGFNVCGVDISLEMLEKARIKSPQMKWVQGDARELPFPNAVFDGAICILATHHIKDIAQAFQEIYRVLYKGRFVIFTSFPEQMQFYWLHEYFPNMMQKAGNVMSDFETIAHALQEAGFRNIEQDRFFVTPYLQDLFLHAGKYRPELYLDPRVRAGISTFALEENQEEVALGCKRIQQDIDSRKIEQIIKRYESALGDYAFIMGNR